MATEQAPETYPLIDPNFEHNRQRRLGRVSTIMERMKGPVKSSALHHSTAWYKDLAGATKAYEITPRVIWGMTLIAKDMLKDLIEIDHIKKEDG